MQDMMLNSLSIFKCSISQKRDLRSKSSSFLKLKLNKNNSSAKSWISKNAGFSLTHSLPHIRNEKFCHNKPGLLNYCNVSLLSKDKLYINNALKNYDPLRSLHSSSCKAKTSFNKSMDYSNSICKGKKDPFQASSKFYSDLSITNKEKSGCINFKRKIQQEFEDKHLKELRKKSKDDELEIKRIKRRQRLEIYALNKIMAEEENAQFLMSLTQDQ